LKEIQEHGCAAGGGECIIQNERGLQSGRDQIGNSEQDLEENHNPGGIAGGLAS
jgi:hypothetical protein